MLARYRAAARRGVSVQAFSDNLQEILLKEVEMNQEEDGGDVTDEKMTTEE